MLVFPAGDFPGSDVFWLWSLHINKLLRTSGSPLPKCILWHQFCFSLVRFTCFCCSNATGAEQHLRSSCSYKFVFISHFSVHQTRCSEKNKHLKSQNLQTEELFKASGNKLYFFPLLICTFKPGNAEKGQEKCGVNSGQRGFLIFAMCDPASGNISPAWGAERDF